MCPSNLTSIFYMNNTQSLNSWKPKEALNTADGRWCKKELRSIATGKPKAERITD